jgi:hypothetical protein
MRRLVVSARAEPRLREAAAWLARIPVGEEVVVVAATRDAASEHIRALAKARGSAFGLHRFTLGQLAAELAKLALIERDLASVGALAIEALCARLIDQLRGQLPRLSAVADQPGLPRALARTLDELRMVGATDSSTSSSATPTKRSVRSRRAGHSIQVKVARSAISVSRTRARVGTPRRIARF